MNCPKLFPKGAVKVVGVQVPAALGTKFIPALATLALIVIHRLIFRLLLFLFNGLVVYNRVLLRCLSLHQFLRIAVAYDD